MNPYIGHSSQISGVEEHRLCGGKGDGMRLFQVTNGKGMELTVSPDRNGDITRLRCFGINLSYMSPCGYVSPQYYRDTGSRWLQSFTAGFLTTCGLNNVGTPGTDEGEELSLHGTIANQPCEKAYFFEEEGQITVCTETSDEYMFGRKLRLHRRLTVSKEENRFQIEDTVINAGDKTEPFEILYHMNMGYPLLDEDSVVEIPSVHVRARDSHALEDLENWAVMEKPAAGYRERCYYHEFEQGSGSASVFQPKSGVRLSVAFDPEELDAFVEWKMMGVREYVLGLECGNCFPEGRKAMRECGMLKFLAPGETKTYKVTVTIRKDPDEKDRGKDE